MLVLGRESPGKQHMVDQKLQVGAAATLRCIRSLKGRNNRPSGAPEIAPRQLSNNRQTEKNHCSGLRTCAGFHATFASKTAAVMVVHTAMTPCTLGYAGVLIYETEGSRLRGSPR